MGRWRVARADGAIFSATAPGQRRGVRRQLSECELDPSVEIAVEPGDDVSIVDTQPEGPVMTTKDRGATATETSRSTRSHRWPMAGTLRRMSSLSSGASGAIG
jgi:hypothetical protein